MSPPSTVAGKWSRGVVTVQERKLLGGEHRMEVVDNLGVDRLLADGSGYNIGLIDSPWWIQVALSRWNRWLGKGGRRKSSSPR